MQKRLVKYKISLALLLTFSPLVFIPQEYKDWIIFAIGASIIILSFLELLLLNQEEHESSNKVISENENQSAEG